MIFNYDAESKRFDLTKSNLKKKVFGDKMIYEIPKKKRKVMKTIEAFTKYFQDLSEYQISCKNNPFEIIKELSIYEKIENYSDIIFEYLKKGKNKDYKELYIYKEKIMNYIFNKIYDKIYPTLPCEMDNEKFYKLISLSWVEPQYFLGNKDYAFDNILPDILNKFEFNS